MPLSPFHSHVTGESLRRLFRELRMILLSGAAGDLAEDAEHHIRGMALSGGTQQQLTFSKESNQEALIPEKHMEVPMILAWLCIAVIAEFVIRSLSLDWDT